MTERRSVPPSRRRYAEAHPSIGVHVDRTTYDRLQRLRETTGASFAYLVCRSLGVVEKEVTRIHKHSFNKGKHEGLAEGRKLGRADEQQRVWDEGYRDGLRVGREEGRAAGFVEARDRYRLTFRCARCSGDISIVRGDGHALAAISALEFNGIGHRDCPR